MQRILNAVALIVTILVSVLSGFLVSTSALASSSYSWSDTGGGLSAMNMADKIPNGRAAVLVRCKTSGKSIMVERAMYWNNRGAGTDTIGGYSD
ncbi:MAG TPA: hypothetical protein VIK22_07955 [Candidatus Anoxymicrobiaceae bacterium]|jgi:hypothetical protein